MGATLLREISRPKAWTDRMMFPRRFKANPTKLAHLLPELLETLLILKMP